MERVKKAACAAILVIVVGTFIFCLNGCGASFRRDMKSLGSDLGGGLDRTVSVYSYDGKLIKSYTGRFDVSDDSGETYFDVDGKRIIIQGGIVINEEN